MPDFSSIFESTFGIVVMIIFFGGSIFVHELGHFLAAKWRGLKVLKFSIGFGPKICAWKGKDGCEYRVSLLPFGGYVALPQLADMGRIEGGEGKGSDGMTEEERLARTLPEISYFDKMVVSAAGAFFNLLFALILAIIIWVVGIPASVSLNSTQVGFVPEDIVSDNQLIKSPAYLAGIQEGDKILEVDFVKPENFSNIAELIAMGTGRSADGKPQVELKIERDGKVLDVSVNPVLVTTNSKTGDEIRMIGIYPVTSMKVSVVMENSPAQRAGIKENDVVKKVDNIEVFSNSQVGYILKNAKKEVDVEVLRDGKIVNLKVTPQKIFTTKPLCSLFMQDGKKAIDFLSLSSDKAKNLDVYANGSIALLWVNKNLEFLKNAKAGDILLQFNGAEVQSLSELKELIDASSNVYSKMLLSNPNGTNMREVVLQPHSNAEIEKANFRMLMGYEIKEERVILHPDVMAQFKENIVRTWGALKSLVSPSSDIGLKHLSGPVGIGRVMYQFSLIDITLVLSFAVLVNINLAILNLLPIPVLDGGHMMFATIARIMRRKIPEGFVASLQGIFMLLFVFLMFYVFYFDIMRWSGDNSEQDLENLYKVYYVNDVNFKK